MARPRIRAFADRRGEAPSTPPAAATGSLRAIPAGSGSCAAQSRARSASMFSASRGRGHVPAALDLQARTSSSECDNFAAVPRRCRARRRIERRAGHRLTGRVALVEQRRDLRLIEGALLSSASAASAAAALASFFGAASCCLPFFSASAIGSTLGGSGFFSTGFGSSLGFLGDRLRRLGLFLDRLFNGFGGGSGARPSRPPSFRSPCRRRRRSASHRRPSRPAVSDFPSRRSCVPLVIFAS